MFGQIAYGGLARMSLVVGPFLNTSPSSSTSAVSQKVRQRCQDQRAHARDTDDDDEVQ